MMNCCILCGTEKGTFTTCDKCNKNMCEMCAFNYQNCPFCKNPVEIILDIKELNLDLIHPNYEDMFKEKPSSSKIVVIGKPGTGKSFLITSLLYAKSPYIPTGLVFSGTESINKHFQQFIPSTFIYNELIPSKIEDFIKRQQIAKAYVPNAWSLLLIDDCMDDPKILKTPLFQKLYKNGRHFDMLYILSLQYCMDIMPGIRGNVDGVFILREPNIITRKKLWENYAGVIPDFSIFCDIMNEITNDHTALYINNMSTSNTWKENVFWYKAKPVPEGFKFGCPDYWQFHYERFNENYFEKIF